jgi:hypothetical protein
MPSDAPALEYAICGKATAPPEWRLWPRFRLWLANKISPAGVYSFHTISLGSEVTSLSVVDGELIVKTAPRSQA